MHRQHSAYCVVCDQGIYVRGSRKFPDEDIMCYKCLANPPLEYQCGAITSSGKPCKKRKYKALNNRCNYHRNK